MWLLLCFRLGWDFKIEIGKVSRHVGAPRGRTTLTESTSRPKTAELSQGIPAPSTRWCGWFFAKIASARERTCFPRFEVYISIIVSKKLLFYKGTLRNGQIKSMKPSSTNTFPCPGSIPGVSFDDWKITQFVLMSQTCNLKFIVL